MCTRFRWMMSQRNMDSPGISWLSWCNTFLSKWYVHVVDWESLRMAHSLLKDCIKPMSPWCGSMSLHKTRFVWMVQRMAKTRLVHIGPINENDDNVTQHHFVAMDDAFAASSLRLASSQHFVQAATATGKQAGVSALDDDPSPPPPDDASAPASLPRAERMESTHATSVF